MLGWICAVFLLLYAGVLTVLLWFRRRPGGRTVILQIAADYPAVGLEWLLYSFRAFSDNYLPAAAWLVEPAAAAPPEQLELLRYLMGRFAYGLPECYNQRAGSGKCYRFTAAATVTVKDWQRQLAAQTGGKLR